jgi:hypothetical protein
MRLKTSITASIGGEDVSQQMLSSLTQAAALRTAPPLIARVLDYAAHAAIAALTYSLPFILAPRLGFWSLPASFFLSATFWSANLASFSADPFSTGLPGTRIASSAQVLAHHLEKRSEN